MHPPSAKTPAQTRATAAEGRPTRRPSSFQGEANSHGSHRMPQQHRTGMPMLATLPRPTRRPDHASANPAHHHAKQHNRRCGATARPPRQPAHRITSTLHRMPRRRRTMPTRYRPPQLPPAPQLRSLGPGRTTPSPQGHSATPATMGTTPTPQRRVTHHQPWTAAHTTTSPTSSTPAASPTPAKKPETS
jgi:hypothetical protein